MKDIGGKVTTTKQVVEVEWIDAAFYGGSRHPADEFPLVLNKTIGYLVSRDKTKVVLTHEYAHDGTCRGTTVIPKAIIVRVKCLSGV